MSSNHLTDHSPLHCTYKLDDKAAEVLDENAADIDQNGAAAESEHHQLFGLFFNSLQVWMNIDLKKLPFCRHDTNNFIEPLTFLRVNN